MNKTFLFASALLCAGCFIASCSNDDEELVNVQPTNKTVTIHAGISEDAATRIALGESVDGKTKVLWSAGDAFSLIEGGEEYKFSRAVDDIEETSVADFIYTGTATLPDITTFGNTDYFWYPYPHHQNEDYVLQTGREEDISNYVSMRASFPENASWDNLHLTFKHSTTVIRIALTNDAFKDKNVIIRLHAKGLIASGCPTVISDELAANENGTVTAFFVIPVSSSRTLSNCCIYADCENIRYKTTLADKTVEKGKLYKIAKNDLVETDEKIQCELPAGDTFRKTIAELLKSNYQITKIKFITNSPNTGDYLCNGTSNAYMIINDECLEIHTTAEEYVADSYCAYMFSGSANYSSGALKDLTEIDFNNCFNTENVTNMDGMFYYSRNLTKLDISNFSFASNPTVGAMFNGIAADVTEKPIHIYVNESGHTYLTETTTDCCIYDFGKFVKPDGTDWE